jgi:hypothetical protein
VIDFSSLVVLWSVVGFCSAVGALVGGLGVRSSAGCDVAEGTITGSSVEAVILIRDMLVVIHKLPWGMRPEIFWGDARRVDVTRVREVVTSAPCSWTHLPRLTLNHFEHQGQNTNTPHHPDYIKWPRRLQHTIC